MSGSHLSREFFDLVKAIGECRSKQEEDKIIEAEIQLLKQKFMNVQNSKKLRELLIRSVYVEMLGHDASTFAYIHGLNLSHNKSLSAKRVGYLVSTLFLDPTSSELMILLINTIQKDLKSSNFLEVTFALTVVSRLANPEMVPVLAQQIIPLLSHSSELVRKRAVAAFHRLVQIHSSGLDNIHSVVRKSLCDPDPSVMTAGLNLLQDIANSDSSACKDLAPTIAGILKQVIDQRLPKDYEYHRMPAPWLQIRLVALLAAIQTDNDIIVSTVQETMRRADIGSNAGAAVAFECVKCAASLRNHTLLEQAAHVISKFMASDNHNYKYMGVTGLSLLVAISPSYATEHQMLVVDCLEDSDDTLRRRTIELLTQMTNANNVTVVVEKMLAQLEDKRNSDDDAFKKDLSSRVCSLCERFAPSNEWYLRTINAVASKQSVARSVTENLTRLVAEQDGEDDTGVDLRIVAANEYIGWLERFVSHPEIKKNTTVQFLTLTVWMIGEFATLATLDGYSVEDTVDLLIDSVHEILESELAGCVPVILSSVAKIAVLSSDICKASALSLFEKLERKAHMSVNVHRRCRDLILVLRQPVHVQRALLPLDAACEDISVDIRFLDSFCNEARINGAREYKQPIKTVKKELGIKTVTTPSTALSGLRFEAYDTPKIPTGPVVRAVPVSAEPTTPVAVSSVQQGTTSLNVVSAGPKRWGPQALVVKKSMAPTESSSSSSAVHAPSTASSQIVRDQSPPATTAPTLTKGYIEKQRMAAALFSGVSSGMVPKAPSVGSRTSVPKKSPVITKQEVVSDLLDFGPQLTSATPEPVPAKTEPNRQVSDDLLDL